MSNERGMTLVEMLAATAIVGIAIAGLFTIVPVAASAIEEGRQASTAVFFAEQKLEEVRGARWTDATDCLGVSAANAAPTSTGCDATPACTPGTPCTTFGDEPGVGNGVYSRTVRITDCGGSPGCGIAGPATADLRLVTVRVGYRPRIGTDGVSPAKQVSLDLLVARQP